MGSVEVEVNSQLGKIVSDLDGISKKALQTSSSMKTMGEDVGKAINNQTKMVQNSVSMMGSFLRRTADQIKKDFQALGSVVSLASGLKLTETMGGSVKEAVTLSDTIRRLSPVFGIASKDFTSFQALMQSGLGAIGASSEAAANALKGLAETPVRGQKNLLAYAKTATELASIGGEKGNEGAVAKGLSNVITSRGGNPNNVKEMDAASKEVLQIHNATGKSASEITQALTSLYSSTNKNVQAMLKNGGSTTLAAAAVSGGPGATSFIEDYLGKGKYEKAGNDALGFGNILGKNGEINNTAVQKQLARATAIGGGDAQQGLASMGLSSDQAQGFIRLAEAMKTSGAAINGAHKSLVDLNKEYQETMSMSDSFKASMNQVKGVFATPLAAVTQGITKGLNSLSQSKLGAGLVVGGGAALAAVLTGGGLKGLFGMGKDELKKSAIESATGEKVQRVEVINFPDSMGGQGALGGAMDALKKMETMATGGAAAVGEGAAALGTGATVALGVGAAAVGAAAGYGLDKGVSALYKNTKDTETGKALGLEDLDKKIQGVFNDIYMKLSGFQPVQRVHVTTDKKDLRVTKKPSRGSSQ